MLVLSSGYSCIWIREATKWNNRESKYLIHLSSLLCLAVITNGGQDAKDWMARCIMTHKQRVCVKWYMVLIEYKCLRRYSRTSKPAAKRSVYNCRFYQSLLIRFTWVDGQSFIVVFMDTNKHISMNCCMSAWRRASTSSSHYPQPISSRWPGNSKIQNGCRLLAADPGPRGVP